MLNVSVSYYWPYVLFELLLFYVFARINFMQAQKIIKVVMSNKSHRSSDPLLNDHPPVISLSVKWFFVWVLKISCIVVISIATYIRYSQH